MTLVGCITWMIFGAIAGWLAGIITKGKGYGLVGNIIVGIIGSVVGGWLFGFLGLRPVGFMGDMLTSVAGAVSLIVVLRIFTK